MKLQTIMQLVQLHHACKFMFPFFLPSSRLFELCYHFKLHSRTRNCSNSDKDT